MPTAAKKYKLFSAPEGSTEKPVCAFFLSAAGCRNGDKCKFLHTTSKKQAGSPPQQISDSASVVSSESEDSVAPAKATAAPVKIKQEEVDDMFVQNPPKQKKKRRGQDNDIFAAPKNSSKSPASKPSTSSSTPAKSEEQPPSKKKRKTEKAKPEKSGDTDFRSLVSNLPVASFFIPGSTPEPAAASSNVAVKKEQEPAVKYTKENPAQPPNTEAGKKWKKAVIKTQKHDRFQSAYDFDKYQETETANGMNATWIKAKPYGAWCKKHPVAIAIDCEMCETQDPETKVKNPKALCRISVVNADKPDEVLLDTLVKPMWPVTDYRTRINGISEENLENVEFTLEHAQAFMAALCSENTVIVGQAVHNDLAAIRMEHYCVADSAHLYEAKDSLGASVSLKDLVKAIFNTEMPNTHDSVNDARKALECVEHWIGKDGKVEPIERTSKNFAKQLFVHRIPKMCKEEHLMAMFLKHTSVEPSDVDPIEFSGNFGKTHVNFRSSKHASLAFDTLESKAEEEASGRLQKKVYLRNGNYIRVRKMAYPRRQSGSHATPIKNTATPSK